MANRLEADIGRGVRIRGAIRTSAGPACSTRHVPRTDVVHRVYLLSPNSTRSDLTTVTRVATALKSSTSLEIAPVEPKDFTLTPTTPIVRLRKDHVDCQREPVVPSYLACLGVATRHHSDGSDVNTNPAGECRAATVGGSSLRWEVEVLRRAGLLGVPVNLDFDLGSFGRKDVLEARCRFYERKLGLTIPRPRTWIVPGGPLDRLRGHRAPNDVGRLVIKPVDGTCSLGVECLESLSELSPSPRRRVVQELVSSPLKIHGHKVDARAYIVVSGREALQCTVPRLILIRRAVQPYSEGREQAEICSIAYARRVGGPVWAAPLDALEAQDVEDVRGVRQAIARTMAQVTKLVAFYEPEVPFFGIWGVDLALRTESGRIEALLIEVNPEPVLYRGIQTLDSATDKMLSVDVAPRLEAFLSVGKSE